MRQGFRYLSLCLAIGLAANGLSVSASPGAALSLGLRGGGSLPSPEICFSSAGEACPPRPREVWLVGLAHFYDDVGNTMANGEAFKGEDMTVAIRQDLLADWPLGSEARLTSACSSVVVTVTDVLPYCEAQPEVVVDVSPAVCKALFCGGCGENANGVAYGEELVLVEHAERNPVAVHRGKDVTLPNLEGLGFSCKQKTTLARVQGSTARASPKIDRLQIR